MANDLIHFIDGDILTHPTSAIVVPVNCMGVMGAGLALAAKEKFGQPYFTAYRRDCSNGTLWTGHVTHWVDPQSGMVLVNLPTKLHWRDRSLLTDVVKGLDSLVAFIESKCIILQSISIPALGCGLGMLDWRDVKPLIVRKMSPLASNGLNVFVFNPK